MTEDERTELARIAEGLEDVPARLPGRELLREYATRLRSLVAQSARREHEKRIERIYE